MNTIEKNHKKLKLQFLKAHKNHFSLWNAAIKLNITLNRFQFEFNFFKKKLKILKMATFELQLTS